MTERAASLSRFPAATELAAPGRPYWKIFATPGYCAGIRWRVSADLNAQSTMPGVGTIDHEPPQKWAVLERVALTVGLASFSIVGYFAVGLSRDPARARELATPLDDQIPFVASWAWMYLWAVPAALSPLFLVRSRRLLRRTALAYAVVMAVSLVFFTMMPVTSVRLRVDRATLDVTRPSDWLVALIYTIDPPYNCFPSLHVSITALAGFAVWKANRALGGLAVLAAGLVAISVCTIKQHFLLDAIAGLALAAMVRGLILQPYKPLAGEMPAFGWRGTVAFLGLVILVYGGFCGAYLLRS